MPRLTNPQGVTVDVDDDTAATLGAEWTPEKKTPTKDDADARTSKK